MKSGALGRFLVPKLSVEERWDDAYPYVPPPPRGKKPKTKPRFVSEPEPALSDEPFSAVAPVPSTASAISTLFEANVEMKTALADAAYLKKGVLKESIQNETVFDRPSQHALTRDRVVKKYEPDGKKRKTHAVSRPETSFCAEKRAQQFPKEPFVVEHGELMCQVCVWVVLPAHSSRHAAHLLITARKVPCSAISKRPNILQERRQRRIMG